MFKIVIRIGHEKSTGGEVDAATLKKSTANAVNTLTDFYGGAMITEANGAYYDTREKTTQIESYADAVTDEQRATLADLCATIADDCAQDSVLLACEDCGGWLNFVTAKK